MRLTMEDVKDGLKKQKSQKVDKSLFQRVRARLRKLLDDTWRCLRNIRDTVRRLFRNEIENDSDSSHSSDNVVLLMSETEIDQQADELIDELIFASEYRYSSDKCEIDITSYFKFTFHEENPGKAMKKLSQELKTHSSEKLRDLLQSILKYGKAANVSNGSEMTSKDIDFMCGVVAKEPERLIVKQKGNGEFLIVINVPKEKNSQNATCALEHPENKIKGSKAASQFSDITREKHTKEHFEQKPLLSNNVCQQSKSDRVETSKRHNKHAKYSKPTVHMSAYPLPQCSSKGIQTDLTDSKMATQKSQRQVCEITAHSNISEIIRQKNARSIGVQTNVITLKPDTNKSKPVSNSDAKKAHEKDDLGIDALDENEKVGQNYFDTHLAQIRLGVLKGMKQCSLVFEVQKTLSSDKTVRREVKSRFGKNVRNAVRDVVQDYVQQFRDRYYAIPRRKRNLPKFTEDFAAGLCDEICKQKDTHFKYVLSRCKEEITENLNQTDTYTGSLTGKGSRKDTSKVRGGFRVGSTERKDPNRTIPHERIGDNHGYNEKYDDVFEKGYYRLDECVQVERGRKGAKRAFEEPRRKVKTRGIANKHITDCTKSLPVTEEKLDPEGHTDPEEKENFEDMVFAEFEEELDEQINAAIELNVEKIDLSMADSDIVPDIRHFEAKPDVIIRGKKDDCDLLEERYRPTEPRPTKQRKRQKRSKSRPESILMLNMNNSADDYLDDSDDDTDEYFDIA